MLQIIQAIGTALGRIGGILFGISKTVGNSLKSILTPVLNYLLNNWLRVAIWGVFGAIALNLMGTLLAYVLYHLSLTITFMFSNFVTEFTVGLLVNFVLGIFFLFIGRFIHFLLK